MTHFQDRKHHYKHFWHVENNMNHAKILHLVTVLHKLHKTVLITNQAQT